MLHHHVNLMLGLKDFIKFDDILVLHHGQKPDLSLHLSVLHVRQLTLIYDLESHRLPSKLMVRERNLPEGTLAQKSFDFVKLQEASMRDLHLLASASF